MSHDCVGCTCICLGVLAFPTQKTRRKVAIGSQNGFVGTDLAEQSNQKFLRFAIFLLWNMHCDTFIQFLLCWKGDISWRFLTLVCFMFGSKKEQSFLHEICEAKAFPSKSIQSPLQEMLVRTHMCFLRIWNWVSSKIKDVTEQKSCRTWFWSFIRTQTDIASLWREPSHHRSVFRAIRNNTGRRNQFKRKHLATCWQFHILQAVWFFGRPLPLYIRSDLCHSGIGSLRLVVCLSSDPPPHPHTPRSMISGQPAHFWATFFFGVKNFLSSPFSFHFCFRFWYIFSALHPKKQSCCSKYTKLCTSSPCWIYTQLWVKQGAIQCSTIFVCVVFWTASMPGVRTSIGPPSGL